MRGASWILPAVACWSWACAPLADFRPASGLMPGRAGEIGAGAAVLTPRPHVTEPWRGAAQVWTYGDADPLITLSAIGAFDLDAFALGGAIRLNALRKDRTALGVEAELGYAWVALSVPFAWRAFDETWLYTAPRVGNFGTSPLLSVPGGVSARIVDGFMLRTEAHLALQHADQWNPRGILGGAAAYQW